MLGCIRLGGTGKGRETKKRSFSWKLEKKKKKFVFAHRRGVWVDSSNWGNVFMGTGCKTQQKKFESKDGRFISRGETQMILKFKGNNKQGKTQKLLRLPEVWERGRWKK